MCTIVMLNSIKIEIVLKFVRERVRTRSIDLDRFYLSFFPVHLRAMNKNNKMRKEKLLDNI